MRHNAMEMKGYSGGNGIRKSLNRRISGRMGEEDRGIMGRWVKVLVVVQVVCRVDA